VPPQTISEKILSRKSGRAAYAGDVVVCPVDCALGTDGSTPMALDYFAAMGGKRVHSPERIVFALDHYAPAPSRHTTQLHARMREFAAAQGVELWDVGEGIGHQLMVERRRALPGGLAVGADSHSVTYGALNTFATGIGSSDFAAILMCGEVWLRAPETIRVALTGALQPGVYAKDIALALAAALGADGAAYQALEFAGDGVSELTIDDRLVLANMSVEMGAKNAILPADAKTFEYLGSSDYPAVEADPGAAYAREVALCLSTLEPQLALPHQVDNVEPLAGRTGQPIEMVYLGTCTGGRVSDYHRALSILKAAGGPAPGVQLVVTPASHTVLDTLARDGTLAQFIAMGAVIGTPGCGSCCGTCAPIPGDGVRVLSTANRNFKGRMGNGDALIYLASPASCAATAARGVITDPREFEA
jgi:3-isopropylmalate/(R)-2-methylmalate dehydratase large subunit